MQPPERNREHTALVHRARTEQEGHLLVELLGEAGIEAMLRRAPGYAYDGLESVWMGSELYGIYVLEHALPEAQRVIAEFLRAHPPAGAEPAAE